MFKRVKAFALALALSTLGVSNSPLASPQNPPASGAPRGWEQGFDYVVQDVCVDDQGAVIMNVSPADTSARCPHRRDLRPGEPLPYHKQDWPAADELQSKPFGLQRSDSFPIRTQMFGVNVVQARGGGRIDTATGRFMAGTGGGGIYFFSDKYVASGFTDDKTGGFQMFYGPQCASPSEQDRHYDAWIFFSRDAVETRSGSTVARQIGRLANCPQKLLYSYTDWHFETLDLRVRRVDGITRRPFDVLISNHFGGPTIATARNLERFYFTREFGLARWERWQNLDLQQRANDVPRADAIPASGRCDPVQRAPSSGGHWVMVQCRQWTNIAPADNPGGDLPTAWLAKVRQDPLMGEILK